MADQSPPTWNELYDRVPYRFIKFHYISDFELNVRALNPRCVNITNFNQHLDEFMLNSTKNHQNAFTMKYLIEDLNNMISSSPEKFYQKMNALFDVERNMYKQGTLTLTQIDTDILWLLLQSKSNKTAVERYKVYYDSYNSCNMPELGNCIQVLSMEIVASINNVVKLMNIILQKIQAHRDHLNQSKREQVWSGETRKRFAEIQVWFDEVATIIDDTLETIQTMRIYDKLCCVNENKLVIDTFKRLIKLTLVLEMEPTEIVKTETFTTCIIRLLCSNSTLQNAKFNINIKDLNVSILSEEGIDVGKVSLRNFKPERTGHDFYYHLKTLKVDKVRRSRSEHGFIENKYTLIFDLKIEVDKKEINASVMSWPVLVIVHHTQEALARAALMWDKHLTGVDRSSEASVPWSEMRNVLRIYFKNVTGFELKDRQLDAL
ncbi:uncharacterized protein LOC116351855, partial [Contarinia nasturtii]|uniref:uncharacterized protein LOC116351855 n=1 Tax=Contarinia nasturtii TaxID=265458 RepID=UPI0012D3BCF7